LNPTVSIILPVWNGERFLAQAIESVMRQTFEEFELLVIDDGSTDSSRLIAMKEAGTDPRVIVLDTEHRGIAHALNTGMNAAR
jgi:glycosyltransferase involved in cell wall biosynthesis